MNGSREMRRLGERKGQRVKFSTYLKCTTPRPHTLAPNWRHDKVALYRARLTPLLPLQWFTCFPSASLRLPSTITADSSGRSRVRTCTRITNTHARACAGAHTYQARNRHKWVETKKKCKNTHAYIHTKCAVYTSDADAPCNEHVLIYASCCHCEAGKYFATSSRVEFTSSTPVRLRSSQLHWPNITSIVLNNKKMHTLHTHKHTHTQILTYTSPHTYIYIYIYIIMNQYACTLRCSFKPNFYQKF